jgi:hypothetical protein
LYAELLFVRPVLALVLALDPDPVRVLMLVVEVIEAPKTFALCGDSIQVIYSLLAPVEEARLHGGVRWRVFAVVSRVLRSSSLQRTPAPASALELDR